MTASKHYQLAGVDSQPAAEAQPLSEGEIFATLASTIRDRTLGNRDRLKALELHVRLTRAQAREEPAGPPLSREEVWQRALELYPEVAPLAKLYFGEGKK